MILLHPRRSGTTSSGLRRAIVLYVLISSWNEDNLVQADALVMSSASSGSSTSASVSRVYTEKYPIEGFIKPLPHLSRPQHGSHLDDGWTFGYTDSIGTYSTPLCSRHLRLSS